VNLKSAESVCWCVGFRLVHFAGKTVDAKFGKHHRGVEPRTLLFTDDIPTLKGDMVIGGAVMCRKKLSKTIFARVLRNAWTAVIYGSINSSVCIRACASSVGTVSRLKQ
jgi:hypothetical protein